MDSDCRYNSGFVKRENQQDTKIRCLLLTSISKCFGHHYAHLQENKEPVTAFGVLFWFCWMWLVAVVGRCLEGSEHCEGFCFLSSYFAHDSRSQEPKTLDLFVLLFYSNGNNELCLNRDFA